MGGAAIHAGSAQVSLRNFLIDSQDERGPDAQSARSRESLEVCVCDGHHDHLPFKDVNWKKTQRYPKKLCELILKGFKSELTA